MVPTCDKQDDSNLEEARFFNRLVFLTIRIPHEQELAAEDKLSLSHIKSLNMYLHSIHVCLEVGFYI